MIAILLVLGLSIPSAGDKSESEMALEAKGLSLSQQTWVLDEEKSFDDMFDDLRPVQKQFREAEKTTSGSINSNWKPRRKGVNSKSGTTN